MLYDKSKVLKFLPHRDPFLFIDSVEWVGLPGRDLKVGELVSIKELVGSQVIANYRTKAEHPIFAGHFPGNPILPGVVQVEMMAQASSFVITMVYEDPFSLNIEVALLGISDTKFRKPILPEMDLVIKTTCSRSRGTIMSYDCQIFHNDELMSETSVLASLKI